MKTQHVIKIIVDYNEQVHIHTKNFTFYQNNKILCDVIKKVMKGKREKYFYAFIDRYNNLKIEHECVPKDW